MRHTKKNSKILNHTPSKNTEKKISYREFEMGRYQFQIGDLVRRHQVGEPEQMFMFDVQNLGVVTQTIDGSHAEVHVYWQLSERLSYYSVYAAEKVLELVSRANKSDNEDNL
jgi:hypothetical protein